MHPSPRLSYSVLHRRQRCLARVTVLFCESPGFVPIPPPVLPSCEGPARPPIVASLCGQGLGGQCGARPVPLCRALAARGPGPGGALVPELPRPAGPRRRPPPGLSYTVLHPTMFRPGGELAAGGALAVRGPPGASRPVIHRITFSAILTRGGTGPDVPLRRPPRPPRRGPGGAMPAPFRPGGALAAA